MSISAKLIAESYTRFKIRAVTMVSDGGVTLWSSTEGLDKVIADDICSWQQDDYMLNVSIGELEITEFMGKDPKDCIYVVEDEIKTPIDETKWIGKLVYFWDEDQEKLARIGILRNIVDDRFFKYRIETSMGICCRYTYCRPVRRDEVQFVADEDDSKN